MRTEKIFQVSAAGRDLGKIFHIQEMPAMQAEKWAARAVLALGHAGAEMPDDLVGGGWAVLAQVGFQALARLDFAEVEPLMDEMMRCVTVMPDPSNPLLRRPLIPEDIEEVRTIVQLRIEVLQVHMGFSLPADMLGSTSAPVGSRSTS